MLVRRQTKDPIQHAVRDALIAFIAAMAEAQAIATKEAQRAGIAAGRPGSDLLRSKAQLRQEAAGYRDPNAVGWGSGFSRL